MDKRENKEAVLLPGEIEKRSFEIITKEIGDRTLDPFEEPVIKRVIHTTADFGYTDTMRFSNGAVSIARELGYARTLMGRRRYLPEIHSSNFNVRSFGERCAMNSPIQGTAADIIKLAMVRVHDAFRREGLSARLVLQVHDELMVEAPEAEVPRVQELLRECMENVITLAVPLKTDLSVGRNWLACK